MDKELLLSKARELQELSVKFDQAWMDLVLMFDSTDEDFMSNVRLKSAMSYSYPLYCLFISVGRVAATFNGKVNAQLAASYTSELSNNAKVEERLKGCNYERTEC